MVNYGDVASGPESAPILPSKQLTEEKAQLKKMIKDAQVSVVSRMRGKEDARLRKYLW